MLCSIPTPITGTSVSTLFWEPAPTDPTAPRGIAGELGSARILSYFPIQASASVRQAQTDTLAGQEYLNDSVLKRSYLAAPHEGNYHELNIVIVDEGSQGRPPHSAVWLGIECKNTAYQKGLLKEILGVRRELSFVTQPIETKFSAWPRSYVPADPPSCLVVFATDAAVLEYSDPGEVFGIDFFHEPM